MLLVFWYSYICFAWRSPRTTAAKQLKPEQSDRHTYRRLHHRISQPRDLDLWPFDLRVNACRTTAMLMSSKFDADSSNSFLLERGHIPRQTDTQTVCVFVCLFSRALKTPLVILAMNRRDSALVRVFVCSQQLTTMACDTKSMVASEGLLKVTYSHVHCNSGSILETVQNRYVTTSNSNSNCNDLECTWRSFTACNFASLLVVTTGCSYICLPADKISTDNSHRAVPL